MSTRTKRTYNLSFEAVSHVRDLSGRLGSIRSQDGVVEFAIEKLYREVQDSDEEALWARAAEDPEFRTEMRGITVAFRDRDSWPT